MSALILRNIVMPRCIDIYSKQCHCQLAGGWVWGNPCTGVSWHPYPFPVAFWALLLPQLVNTEGSAKPEDFSDDLWCQWGFQKQCQDWRHLNFGPWYSLISWLESASVIEKKARSIPSSLKFCRDGQLHVTPCCQLLNAQYWRAFLEFSR